MNRSDALMGRARRDATRRDDVLDTDGFMCVARDARLVLRVRVGWRTANAIAAFGHSRERAPAVDSGNQAGQLRRDG